MLNRSYLNRLPLNRMMEQGEHILYAARWGETLQGWARVGGDYRIRQRMDEGLHGGAVGTRGMPVGGAWEEELLGRAAGSANVVLRGIVAEYLNGSALARVNYHSTHVLHERLNGDARLVANMLIRAGWCEKLEGSARLGANIFLPQAIYETLNGYAALYGVTESATRVAGEIPPGSTLLIDSENFGVWLDEQSVIERHSGDWIWIGRPTIDLTLSGAGVESFDWEVHYIAQYL